MASAISCRTRWRSGSRSPQLLREQILRAAVAPVPRGRRAALVAAAQRPGRAHAHLRRSRVAVVRHRALRRAHRRSRHPRRRAALHRGPAAAARAARRVLRAHVSEQTATLFEHCRLGLEGALYTGPARPAADRHRRLERRHESRRRTRPRRERVARLVPARHAQRVRAARAGARRTRARHRLARPGHASCAPRSNSTPGMASGIAAASSTTARRSARPATTNAASTPSRSPGA